MRRYGRSPMAARRLSAAALVLAGLVAVGPAGAQTPPARGVVVEPPAAPRLPQPQVRIVEWVNQSFPVPDSIGVFDTPDASREPVARLRVGASVEVLGVLEGQTWLQVRLPEGTVGYVVATAIPGALRPRPASVAPPTDARTVSGPALVHDTATLVVGGQAIALAHLHGIGGSAAQGLQTFIREAGAGIVTCRPAEGGHVCTLADGTDVALAALVNGAAGVKPGAPALYRAQAEDARRNRRGLWAQSSGNATLEEQQARLLPVNLTSSTPPPAFRSAQVAEGLAYLAGQPFTFQEGEAAPLVFVPVVGWGYWDRRQVWRPAQAAWLAQLERRHPGGAGLREVDPRRLGMPVIPAAPRTPASQPPLTAVQR